MDESMHTDPELQVLTERCRTYQGTAKINISQITPHPSISQHMNTKNVERLCEIFDKEGCRRLDIYNHVSAVVSRQHLHEALQAGRVNAADMMTDQPSQYPRLHFSTGSIQCLHGQHRLKAGEHYLPSIDQWWTVDLYLDDISPDLQTSLIDEYSNERVPSDGEIYLKVRQYRNEANAHFENRWLARLSDNKARRLRGLESHPSVRAAFDSLLVLPSLLIHGMQIGSLPQALAICCDEEIVHALTRLLQYWSSLVGHDRARMFKIDLHTVEILQLLAPGVSSKDRTTVKGLVHSGEVFSNFTESERGSIWKRLKRTEGIIPSLYTFFKDLWYLESCANCIKRLFTPSRSFPTIRTAMRAAFLSFDPTNAQFLIQTSEAGFRSYSHSQVDPAELGYRQIWLYAMRHYPKLSKKPQKKDSTAKPNRDVVDPMILYEMAVLAKRLGFQSPQIEELIQQSPDRQIAQDALLRARRPDRYRYNREEIESLINKVTECFLRAVLLDDKLPVQFVRGRESKKESRCGHPQTEAQLQDCQFLFIDQLHDDTLQRERKATSTLVRRSVYFTFFSKLSMPRENNDTAGRSSTPDLPMSPLFILSNCSPQGEGEQFGSAGTGAGQDSNLERRRLKDARRERRQQKQAKKLHRQQRRQQRRHRSSRDDRHPTPYSRNSTSSPGYGDKIARIDSEDSRIGDIVEPASGTALGFVGSSELIEGDHGFSNYEGSEHSHDRFGFAPSRPPLAPPSIGSRYISTELQELPESTVSHGQISLMQPLQSPGEFRLTSMTSLPPHPDMESHEMQQHLLAPGFEGHDSMAPTGKENKILGLADVEDEQPRGGSEENISGRESLKDVNMEAHASEQENEAAETAAQLSSSEEVERALAILEGRGAPEIISGPSRTVVTKSAALRESAKFEPYDRTQRRQQTRKISIPPQETLEQDINALLRTADQAQTARPGTQIDFLKAQYHPLLEMNGEQSSWPVASQVGLTQNQQQIPDERSDSVEFEPQPEISSPINQNSEPHGRMNIRSEQEEQLSESVLLDASPQVHAIAVATQKDTLVKPPSSSLPRESSAQTDTRTRVETFRSDKLPEEQDESPERGEGASDAAKHSVTITFRARDEHGDWNRLVRQMVVDPSDPSPVGRMASKNARERQATFYDQNLRQVPPGQCFDAAIEDGTNTIFMTFGDDLVVSEETVNSIARVLEAGSDDDRPTKRRQ
ncbi:uncharacterized protein N7511_004269 [Penicillium nucicola]|uniref:uncharacterized protein n=1 Tax=Penicillium nucicola TaxID=1850975 RepID=UPI00254555F2|nr:uncharacterized protein N7511_004269 [Penicillium nucicola]KAJ5766653.1 hypothetical protein N7511_004269 [Penicillium nucicola]